MSKALAATSEHIQKHLLVVVPAFNEEESLGGLLAEIRAAFPKVRVLVVSDGSKDLTAAVARDLFVPCAGPWDCDSPWLSDDPDERRWAAERCTGCPVLGECRRAGELERWGIWGAVDRSPKSTTSKETSK